jgi:HK97 family phage prohead protease
MNHLYAALETKFVDGTQLGEFSGYASCYNNVDSHGDVVAPKAFDLGLAELKAEGRGVPMHLQHRIYGGDGFPVGIWDKIESDDKGLKVHGKISGMHTDYGQRIHSLIKDGALSGLSIGFKLRKDGAVMGKKAGEPKRLLTGIDLKEISLVDSPSNALTRVDNIKSELLDEIKELMRNADVGKATSATVAAMTLHRATMSGSDSPTVDERGQMFTHLQDIHEALTGERSPAGMKSAPKTIRELEILLRDEGKFSHAQARAIAEFGFKSASQPRDEENDTANKAAEFLKFLKAG